MVVTQAMEPSHEQHAQQQGQKLAAANLSTRPSGCRWVLHLQTSETLPSAAPEKTSSAQRVEAWPRRRHRMSSVPSVTPQRQNPVEAAAWAPAPAPHAQIVLAQEKKSLGLESSPSRTDSAVTAKRWATWDSDCCMSSWGEPPGTLCYPVVPVVVTQAGVLHCDRDHPWMTSCLVVPGSRERGRRPVRSGRYSWLPSR